ncbi:TPA: hypothetical protein KL772_004845 [Escherichia coli]|uniref:hypothetical protein n=1 Tax=Escherichia coli TaxID=562 RepID=UPI00069C7B51|nr:hypothetical protein [Escherichia coli]EFL9396983.1 hypothetical protein [Escherichia coli]EID5456419.1 hypothetical protein [Escherichia coli]MBC1158965.1 hypothetical protein [Escherichia coli]HBB5010918.1 hypothetical protein [Escherichia coli]HBE5165420.1 hypothetical protein [Escherichia coli]
MYLILLLFNHQILKKLIRILQALAVQQVVIPVLELLKAALAVLLVVIPALVPRVVLLAAQ